MNNHSKNTNQNIAVKEPVHAGKPQNNPNSDNKKLQNQKKYPYSQKKNASAASPEVSQEKGKTQAPLPKKKHNLPPTEESAFGAGNNRIDRAIASAFSFTAPKEGIQNDAVAPSSPKSEGKNGAEKPGMKERKKGRLPATSSAGKAATFTKKPENPKEQVTAVSSFTSKHAASLSVKAVKPSERKIPVGGKLRIIPLGGLAEIGKNMTVIEYGDDIIVIDVGVAFPDEDMFGVDLVIPDVSYLVKNADRVRGFLVTHGHEDHIGAVAYVLAQVSAPIYGTALSLGIIQGKLAENPPKKKPDLRTVSAGDTVRLGQISAEFIHVNHSIADACAIALHTPLGIVYHSGDFKLDVSPIDGKMMDLARIGQLGEEGVKLLLCESTNAERPGFTPSERAVGSSLERIFNQYEDNRLIIATFSSNVHRVQQIIDVSVKHKRKVAVIGRSMVNVINAAKELGYMNVPDGALIDVAEIKRFNPEQITLITTGSQGEPMSALYRIAFSEHDKVKLTSNDVVVLSSSTIPGNEKLIGRIINSLVYAGVKVVSDSVEAVHVSGHACREELKLLMALLKPEYFMPIHGEYRHLYANKEIAEFMGIPASKIFVSEIGKVLEIDAKGAKFAGTVSSGKVLVDGSGVGDIGAVVLRDRKNLAEDGVVAVVASVALHEGMLLSGPDIVSRGFVYVKESEELMEQTRKVAISTLQNLLEKHETDFSEIKAALRDDLAKFIFKQTKRKPMILPIIMDI